MSTDMFSVFNINEFAIRNRLGVAPMTRMSSPGEGIPRQDVLDFLVTRAKNGAGIVYTEAIVTDYESAQGYPRQARMVTQRQLDAWKPVTDAIRKAGAVSICQIFHCGRMAWEGVNPAGRVIAPSSVAPRQINPLTGQPYPKPDAMSQFDIDHVVKGFQETARGAMAAGFDGVEIHGAHGYLISQFLSGYSNQRTDAYGGSMEKRFRFAREVIQAVREVIPGNRLLLFRVSNWGIADMEVSLFESSQEWQAQIRLLSAQPVDAVSVSTYDFRANAFETQTTMAGLTREATDLPILICGKIASAPDVREALKDADIALSGKSMLLNPDWVEDIRSGKPMKPYSSDQANIAYTETPLP